MKVIVAGMSIPETRREQAGVGGLRRSWRRSQDVLESRSCMIKADGASPSIAQSLHRLANSVKTTSFLDTSGLEQIIMEAHIPIFCRL